MYNVSNSIRDGRLGLSQLLWIGFYFVIALANIWVYRGWERSLTADNQHYFFIAERAASGLAPHLSQVDPKTMLAPMLGGLAISAGRTVGLDDVHAAKLLSFLVVGFSVGLMWYLGWRLSGDPWAGHFAALALLGCWGFFHEGAIGARPKVFLVVFQLAAHAALAARRPVLAGLAAAAAFLCWQPGALVGLALVAAVLCSGEARLRRDAGVAFVTGLLVFVLYEAWFFANGALSEQLYQSFVLPALTESKQRPLFGTLILLIREGRQIAAPSAWVPLAATMGLVWFWARMVGGGRAGLDALRSRPDQLAVWIGLHLTLGWTFLDNQAYPDLLLVQPYFALVGGSMLALLARRLASPEDPVLRKVFLASALMGTCLTVWVVSGVDREGEDTVGQQRLLAAEVQKLIDDYDDVWVVGCTHLLALNHRDNWSPYGFFFDDVIQEIHRTEGWSPAKDGVLPPIIVVARGLYRGANEWMGGKYRKYDVPLLKESRIHVLRRSDLDPEIARKRAAPPPHQRKPPED